MTSALIVDGNNYLMRGYYAVPFLSTSTGKPTNAIKGFLNLLMADVKKCNPTLVVIAFDSKEKTWRHKYYPKYKANRVRNSEVVSNLKYQHKPLREILEALGYIVIRKKGVEADDIIATVTKKISSVMPVVISSNDKDFAQLVNDRVRLLQNQNNKTKALLDSKGVKLTYGVEPKQIVEYLMLVGDASDNIPGVYKCGPKTAAKLLTTYKTVKSITKNRKKLTEALRENYLEASSRFDLTRKLITLKDDFHINVPTKNNKYKRVTLSNICRKLELVETYEQLLGLLNDNKHRLW